jgi:endonuclease V-like protein UPF0215 family
MNYFKARYFKAKTNDSWTQVPVIVVTNKGSLVEAVSVTNKVSDPYKERRRLIEDDNETILTIIKCFLECQN